MIKDYLRKDLVDFKPYHAPLKPYEVKIDANENPFKHHPEVIKRAKDWIEVKDNITRYPDTDNNKLREKIAQIYNIQKENITCGVGSDQLIEYIIKVFIEPGDTILVPNPSFSMYELSNTLNHGKTIRYELENDFSYNIDNIIDLYKQHQPKIVFVCTPNNPTGSVISIKDIKKLLKDVKCPVVVDEAYGEFINENMINEVNNFPQLIVIKTFSKAYGLAGLRVGYAIASKEMIELINICKSPYNLSGFSSEMACLVLEYNKYYDELAKELLENESNLYEWLKECKVFEYVFPSNANFILVKVKENIIGLVGFLEENKILVRDYKDGRLKSCLRLTVGTEEENKRLLKVIKAFEKQI